MNKFLNYGFDISRYIEQKNLRKELILSGVIIGL